MFLTPHAVVDALQASSLSPREKQRLRLVLEADSDWLSPLLRAKLSLMNQGASDAEVEALDSLMSALFEADPAPSLGDAQNPELFALLAPERIGALSTLWEPSLDADEPGATPLHWICQSIGDRGLKQPAQGDLFSSSRIPFLIASLKACAQARPDWINAFDHTGQTPLHWAVYFLAIEAIPLLLELGADPRLPNLCGSPPFDPDFFRLYLERSKPSALARFRAEALWRLMERQCLEDAAAEGSNGEGSGRQRL